jgi:hypothetical protein
MALLRRKDPPLTPDKGECMKTSLFAILILLLVAASERAMANPQWCKGVHSGQIHARLFCRRERDEVPAQPVEVSAAGLPPAPTSYELYPGEGPPPPPPQSMCVTQYGSCPMGGYFPSGSPCMCPSPMGPIPGATYP